MVRAKVSMIENQARQKKNRLGVRSGKMIRGHVTGPRATNFIHEDQGARMNQSRSANAFFKPRMGRRAVGWPRSFLGSKVQDVIAASPAAERLPLPLLRSLLALARQWLHLPWLR